MPRFIVEYTKSATSPATPRHNDGGVRLVRTFAMGGRTFDARPIDPITGKVQPYPSGIQARATSATAGPRSVSITTLRSVTRARSASRPWSL